MKKRIIIALFLMILGVSFIPINVNAELKRIDLHRRTYCVEEVEAGTMDLISWSFQSDGKISLYLLTYEDYNLFKAFPSLLMIRTLGEKLAGSMSSASGQFTPEHADTWCFVFLNMENSTVNLRYEVNNFQNYYIILPTIIVLAIVIGGGFGLHVYQDQKKQKKRAKQEATMKALFAKGSPVPPIEEQLEKLQQITRQPPSEEPVPEYCPACGSEVVNRNAKVCDKCKHEFRKKE